MAYTYDTTTDRGKVRMLADDTGTRYNPDTKVMTTPGADSCLYTDAEIDMFLSLSGSVVFLAAAMAIESMALKEAQLGNEVRRGAYESARGSASAELAQRAARLRAMANEEGAFGRFVEMDWTPQARVDRVTNEGLRSSTEWWNE